MKRRKRNNFFKVGLLAIGASTSTVFAADTWYVDDSAPTSGQTGTTWSHPYVTIQQVFSDSSFATGDEIHLAQGTYKPASQSTSLDLQNAVRIKGGYAGYGASNPDDRNPSTYVTTLSGDLGGGTHAYHVVKAASTVGPPSFTSSTPYEDRANLDGATITGGRASGSGTNQKVGGGIFIDQGHPTIRNCIITDNHANGTVADTGDGAASIARNYFAANA